MRKELGLYANLRPIKLFDELLGASSIKPEILKGADILFFRELTGDIYFGEKGRKNDGDTAYDIAEYSRYEVQRIGRKAFEAARTRRKKLCSVDKANVLETSRLWREEIQKLATEYPDVEVEHQFVDSTAMLLIKDPCRFDVVVTANLFGDILSDELAGLVGGLGLAPGANIGKDVAIFEAVHGSAPDIAGKGIANPISLLLASGLMLDHVGHSDLANRLRQAIDLTLNQDNIKTTDLGGKATTIAFTEALVKRIKG
jgi:3-isopropylmalate dehydrogenase